MKGGKEMENERAVALNWRENAERGTSTPRLRAPVGTPGETGDWRPDGRKPVAGEGAGPGSVGVTGDPVAGSERENAKES